MRLFFAVNLDDPTKSRMAEIQNSLRMDVISAAWTRREDMHMTLNFMGEVSAEHRISELQKAAQCLKSAPVELVFTDFGSFGGGLYYAGIQHTPELMALQAQLLDYLRQSDFYIEMKAFCPHVTLARNLRADGRVDAAYAPFSMWADRVSLMRSEFIKGKAVYTEIFGVSLA